jgi:carboxyl-terminal processing protease
MVEPLSRRDVAHRQLGSAAGARPRRRRCVAGVPGLIFAGCLTLPPAEGLQRPDTVVSVGSLDVAVTGCDDPPAPFAVVCEAHGLMRTAPLVSVDDTALAKAALTLLHDRRDVQTPEPKTDVLTCAAPTEAFVPVCEAYAQRWLPGHEQELVDLIVLGMLRGVRDRYASYLNADAYEKTQQHRNSVGIGAFARIESADGPDGLERCFVISDTCPLRIVGTVPGFPAEVAGLRPGEAIVAVDGEGIDGMFSFEVAHRLQGAAGTQIHLTIESTDGVREVRMTRASVERLEVALEEDAESRDDVRVDRRMVSPQWPHAQSEIVNDTGYVRLFRFEEDTADVFVRHWRAMLDAGARRLVLDLRDNPGGSMTAMVELADLFLDEGVVITIGGPDGATQERSSPGGMLTDPAIRVIILVDRASASASEALAAALKDRGRATVVGETTFGKGVMQTMLPLDTGGVLTLTTHRALPPSGTSFDGRGLRPNIAAEVGADAPAQIVAELDGILATGPHP